MIGAARLKLATGPGTMVDLAASLEGNEHDMVRIAGIFFLCLLGNAAQAASSPWLQTPGGDVRLVALAPEMDGTIPAILDIRLNEGWKTYWLDPGESGIAPQISFSPDSNVTFSGLRFPAPKRFDDGVVRYTGFDQPVAFPISLNGGPQSSLKASVFLGICKDICIPVQGELTVDLKAGATMNLLEKAIVEQAEAALPEAAAADFTVTSHRLDKDGGRLQVVLTIPPGTAIADVDIFLAGPSGESFSKPENVVLNGNELTAELTAAGQNAFAKLAGKTLTLVAVAGGRSMQTALAFD